jgi:hypothetical protein
MVFNEREVAVPRRCEDVGLSNDARSGSSLRNVSCGNPGGGGCVWGDGEIEGENRVGKASTEGGVSARKSCVEQHGESLSIADHGIAPECHAAFAAQCVNTAMTAKTRASAQHTALPAPCSPQLWPQNRS